MVASMPSTVIDDVTDYVIGLHKICNTNLEYSTVPSNLVVIKPTFRQARSQDCKFFFEGQLQCLGRYISITSILL